jgi:hypothetical protein
MSGLADIQAEYHLDQAGDTTVYPMFSAAPSKFERLYKSLAVEESSCESNATNHSESGQFGEP